MALVTCDEPMKGKEQGVPALRSCHGVFLSESGLWQGQETGVSQEAEATQVLSEPFHGYPQDECEILRSQLAALQAENQELRQKLGKQAHAHEETVKSAFMVLQEFDQSQARVRQLEKQVGQLQCEIELLQQKRAEASHEGSQPPEDHTQAQLQSSTSDLEKITLVLQAAVAQGMETAIKGVLAVVEQRKVEVVPRHKRSVQSGAVGGRSRRRGSRKPLHKIKCFSCSEFGHYSFRCPQEQGKSPSDDQGSECPDVSVSQGNGGGLALTPRDQSQ